ncbi:MAG: type I restriction endonuclease [Anaerolineaceae bacterium]|nr:type I restriction endonuclease [Anaerolineaceae bacterium]
MSDQLLRAIENVRSEIANHFEDYRQNEEQTKQSLINPILNALGWDTFDRTRVQQQYRAGRGKVDMALVHEDKPVVLIEAKSLDETLGEDAIDQIIRYFTRTTAKTAVLTNGSEWRVYRPLLNSKPEFERRLLFEFRIDNDDGKEVARKLLSLRYKDMANWIRKTFVFSWTLIGILQARKNS